MTPKYSYACYTLYNFVNDNGISGANKLLNINVMAVQDS